MQTHVGLNGCVRITLSNPREGVVHNSCHDTMGTDEVVFIVETEVDRVLVVGLLHKHIATMKISVLKLKSLRKGGRERSMEGSRIHASGSRTHGLSNSQCGCYLH